MYPNANVRTEAHTCIKKATGTAVTIWNFVLALARHRRLWLNILLFFFLHIASPRSFLVSSLPPLVLHALPFSSPSSVSSQSICWSCIWETLIEWCISSIVYKGDGLSGHGLQAVDLHPPLLSKILFQEFVCAVYFKGIVIVSQHESIYIVFIVHYFLGSHLVPSSLPWKLFVVFWFAGSMFVPRCFPQRKVAWGRWTSRIRQATNPSLVLGKVIVYDGATGAVLQFANPVDNHKGFPHDVDSFSTSLVVCFDTFCFVPASGNLQRASRKLC